MIRSIHGIITASRKPRPFGSDPGALSGVTVYNGTATRGEIQFKTAGTYNITPSESGLVEALVVAGGGAGAGSALGISHSGGGGGGGIRHDDAFAIVSGSALTVTVGAGGVKTTSGTTRVGTHGEDSVFGSLTAGGGRRGQYYGGDSGTPQSKVGGSNSGSSPGWGCGGGGGASADGSNGASNAGGNGGDGLSYFGSYWSGGGGGGVYSSGTVGTGGLGGATNGTTAGNDASDATANTGGGGGGGGAHASYAANGGNGGSGIVIVRWGGYTG